jgi:hypothetical protein
MGFVVAIMQIQNLMLLTNNKTTIDLFANSIFSDYD